MREIANCSEFLIKVRRRMRQGELSRERLKLHRLEWRAGSIECDWLMRPTDPWDRDLPKRLIDEHQTLQALRDALSLRDLIFKSFPEVDCAELRMFREGFDHSLELMMTGSVRRSDEVLPRVASVAMRAMLCGFRFTLTGGVLVGGSSVPLQCF